MYNVLPLIVASLRYLQRVVLERVRTGPGPSPGNVVFVRPLGSGRGDAGKARDAKDAAGPAHDDPHSTPLEPSNGRPVSLETLGFASVLALVLFVVLTASAFSFHDALMRTDA